MSPLTKGLGILFGMPVVLTAVFFTYFITTGEERMKAICAEVTPGMSYAQLKEFALDKRLRVPNREPGQESGVVFLADSRSYGRHACRVELEAGLVKLAAYSFVD